MSSTVLSPARAGNLALTVAAPLFTATLFLSAFLLFGVQPMFAKMVLPLLGGSPSVWSVATVFFQAMLLAGYGYAHLLTRTLDIRRAALVHVGLMVAALSALPIARAHGWEEPPAEGQALWLIAFFFVSVGLPFFAVSANGPLMQAWFSRSGHKDARDPYFLYGASNIGSFAALIAYPFVIEPLLTLSMQAQVWTGLFLALGAGIVLCAAVVARGGLQRAAVVVPMDAVASVPWRERLAWIGLSFVPSGLLVSVTAHLSTDVAAVPLLWVVPLAIFLLTFVVTFRPKPLVSATVLGAVQIWAAALGLINLEARSALGLTLLVHLGLFGVNALVCHRALYERRPSAARLTEFYLTMSLGGVLGGVFAALVAPVIFSSIIEYPLLIVAALLCQPGFIAALRRASLRDVAIPVASAMAVMALGWVLAGRLATLDQARIGVAVAIGAAALMNWRKPVRVVALLAMVAVSVTMFGGLLAPRETYRSFFGVMKVREMLGGQFRTLEHGTTLHGAMRIREPDGSPHVGPVEPTTYYTPQGPLGVALSSVRAAHGPLGHVSMIGLGVGAMACHMQHGERLTYYEIDPLVVRLATNPNLFRFLQQCAPAADIVVGDARLTLAKSSAPSDLIVVDAFSSDAIPVHLMTREAIGLYRSKLTPHGVLLFHISNLFMDLRSLVARGAALNGFKTYVRAENSDEPFEARLRTTSVVAALVRDRADLGPLASDAQWTLVPVDPARSAWTDDFSNILDPVLERVRR